MQMYLYSITLINGEQHGQWASECEKYSILIMNWKLLHPICETFKYHSKYPHQASLHNLYM